MKNIRLIARLDVKSPNLVKGVQLEGLRKIGDPNEFAHRYYLDGADEILYIDIVASLYERNSLVELVRRTTKDVFVPITVGGGIRTVEDAQNVLRAGADKIAVNTAALKRPELIKEIAQKFGSQCMVLSIQAKRVGMKKWEAYYDNGREKTGIDVLEWAKQGEDLGAGEILLTSVDREGTGKGLDLELIEAVNTAVSIPVIAGGGIGRTEDIVEAVRYGLSEAVAMAHVLHYNKLSIPEIRLALSENGINVRRYEI
nr:imidazole glycerol phosphate synthase cyclase subunit [uncultured Anaeromusa sp.]